MRSLGWTAMLVGLVAATAMPSRAAAYSYGITGRAQSGCGTAGNCHGNTPGATAMITGPASLAPGATGTYTLVVTSTVAGFSQGGLDVSATGGTLAANAMEPDTMVSRGEVIHTAPIARGSDGTLQVAFDVQAPASGGTISLSAAGNATSGHGTRSSAWALATLDVTVSGGTTGTDAGTTPPPPRDGGTPGGQDAGVAMRGGLLYDPGYSNSYGGCAVSTGDHGERTGRTGTGAGAGAGAWVLLGALAWRRGRRR